MRTLDETDLEILRLLLDDSRRPFSEIAERVDRSPPTVSDRVDRLVDLGVIDRFTIDVDRSRLSGGIQVLLELETDPVRVDQLVESLVALEEVEHVFLTAGGRIVASATMDASSIRASLADRIDVSNVDRVSVHLVDRAEWTPSLATSDLSLCCDECGNRVGGDGEAIDFDGTRRHFCCSDCRSRFEERHSSVTKAA